MYTVQSAQVKGRLSAKPNSKAGETRAATSTRDPIVQTKRPHRNTKRVDRIEQIVKFRRPCVLEANCCQAEGEFIPLEALKSSSVTWWPPHSGFTLDDQNPHSGFGSLSLGVSELLVK